MEFIRIAVVLPLYRGRHAPPLFLAADAKLFKELRQKERAVFLYEASKHFRLVVEAPFLHDVHDAPATARLRIHGADHYTGKPRLNDGAGAHGARLQCNIHGAGFQTPVAYLFGSLLHRGDFSVGKGGMIGIATVVAAADDGSRGDFAAQILGKGIFLSGKRTVIHNDATDWHLTDGGGLLCLCDGL